MTDEFDKISIQPIKPKKIKKTKKQIIKPVPIINKTQDYLRKIAREEEIKNKLLAQALEREYRFNQEKYYEAARKKQEEELKELKTKFKQNKNDIGKLIAEKHGLEGKLMIMNKLPLIPLLEEGQVGFIEPGKTVRIEPKQKFIDVINTYNRKDELDKIDRIQAEKARELSEQQRQQLEQQKQILQQQQISQQEKEQLERLEIEKKENELRRLTDEKKNRIVLILNQASPQNKEVYIQRFQKLLGIHAQPNQNLTFSQIFDNVDPTLLAHIMSGVSNPQSTSKKQTDKYISDKVGEIETAIKNALPKRKGKGIDLSKQDGLYDDQLEVYLQPLEKYGFLGVFMSDEIDRIPVKALQKVGSMIMNLDNSHEMGSHWIGLYWDLRHKAEGSIEDPLHRHASLQNQGIFYYDPFGRSPSKDFLKRIKKLMNKIKKKFNIDYELYFEYNKNMDQDINSNECGYFSTAFIIDMMNGYPFNAGPDKNQKAMTRKNEKNIKEFKKDFEDNIIPDEQILD